MILEDKGVHRGHRARMRAKFSQHGARIFDTYELLEMLLYNTVPQRDTNPIAKRLLAHFGSLDGVMSAKAEELLSAGVGARTAELISLVGRADLVGALSKDVRPVTTFSDYGRLGKFLVGYFKRRSDVNVIGVMLDNSMRLLGVADIDTPRFGSAATTARPFIDAAMRFGATIAVVAFTHRNGLIFPYDADVVTCRMLESELAGVGVTLYESCIVDGERFAHVGPKKAFKSAYTPAMESFNRTRDAFTGYEVDGELSGLESGIAQHGDYDEFAVRDYLGKLLSYVRGTKGTEAELLSERYGSLDAVLSENKDTLEGMIGDGSAQLLKLTAAISSRRVTDLFLLGRRPDNSALVRYLCALFYGTSVETVYVLSMDAKDRITACDAIGEGTINSSDVYPRKVVECALRRGASKIIIAHNHPTGAALPSNDDMVSTATLFATCRAAGIRLYRHIIVTERDHFVLEPDVESGVTLAVGRLV